MSIETVTDLIAQKRFLSEVEHGIRAANREVIHDAVPELNKARLPATALIDQLYAHVQARGGGRWDTSSLIHLLQNE